MTDHPVRLPDVGEGIAQAEIVQWHVAVGDHLEPEQPFVDVMTDKATVELPSPVAGTVRVLGGEVGEFVPVGAPLLWVALDQPTTDADDPEDPEDPGITEVLDHAASAAPTSGTSPRVARPTSDRPRAAPAVRARAAELGIDLTSVRASGPDGRVLHRDLDAVLATSYRVESPSSHSSTRIPLIGLRRNIARRMQEAHRIPHFSYVESINVDALLALRARLNEDHVGADQRVTLLPFIMRAIVRALRDFPGLNARYHDDTETIEQFDAVHLGIAIQTDKGLMVAVLHHAEAADIWQMAAELRRLSEAANNGTITLRELTGSTITVTSLGALGGIVSTPLINAPEVAIVGVNRIVEQPAVINGQLHNLRTINLSSSFDHRVIDGAEAAGFIHRVRDLLQNPALLFIRPPE